MLLALYGVFANIGTFSVLCSIRLTFSNMTPTLWCLTLLKVPAAEPNVDTSNNCLPGPVRDIESSCEVYAALVVVSRLMSLGL